MSAVRAEGVQRVQIANAFRPLFDPEDRYKVYWGGRGAAKSWNFAIALLIMGRQRTIRVLCTRELQVSIKDSVLKLLEDRIDDMGFQDHYQVLNSEIRGKNGTLFIFKGIKHSVSEIKSTEGIDYCWIEEAENVTKKSWRALIPTIRKPGSQIWVSFNPRKKTDETYKRFVINPPDDCMVRKVSWRDNPWFPEVLRKEMESDKRLDYDEYLHVWEGMFKAFADNAVYGKQLKAAREEGRVLSIPIEPTVAVNTFWDLGKDDHTAIWFHQQVGAQHRFIDYYQSRLEELSHYARVVKNKDYLWGKHYLPHDVEHDILGMSKTRKIQLQDMGIKPIKVVPKVRHLNEGVEQTRRAFASCYFDAVRCEEGLETLSNYERKYDDDNDTHSENPIHNWASNGADAFRQFGQGYRGSQNHWERLVKPNHSRVDGRRKAQTTTSVSYAE